MNSRWALALAALVATGVGYWIWSIGGPAPEIAARPAPSQASTADAAHSPAAIPKPSTDAGSADDDAHHARPLYDVESDDHEHREVEDPTGDLGLYDREPMSRVPHRVVRGWGARGAGSVPGFVGAVVIVEPDLTDDALAQLARDILRFHSDAKAISIRILDLERAGTYDRHSDGGALIAEHLVGLINRNEGLGTERITIRGRDITISD